MSLVGWILLGEVLLVTVVGAVMAVIAAKLRSKRLMAAMVALLDRVASAEEARRQELSQHFREVFRLDAGTADSLGSAIAAEEKRCVGTLARALLEHDIAALERLDVPLVSLGDLILNETGAAVSALLAATAGCEASGSAATTATPAGETVQAPLTPEEIETQVWGKVERDAAEPSGDPQSSESTAEDASPELDAAEALPKLEAASAAMDEASAGGDCFPAEAGAGIDDLPQSAEIESERSDDPDTSALDSATLDAAGQPEQPAFAPPVAAEWVPVEVLSEDEEGPILPERAAGELSTLDALEADLASFDVHGLLAEPAQAQEDAEPIELLAEVPSAAETQPAEVEAQPTEATAKKSSGKKTKRSTPRSKKKSKSESAENTGQEG